MAKKKDKGSYEGSLFETEVPQMPEGFYSGDQPNPRLRAFVEEHLKEKPYRPDDGYNVAAFAKAIETTKATAIYNMHTYWSKKPHDAIREYIRHYTEPGDLVLDPFCGSGGTALSALIEGRKAVAIDRSPAATFITRNYCTPVDVTALEKAFAELEAKVKPEIDWLYDTKCDRCDGRATISYTVYSQVFECPRCMQKVALFDCVEADGKTAAGKPKAISVCPHCHARGFQEEISTSSQKFGSVPVLVSYLCENGCKPVRDQRRHNDADPRKREYFEKYDLGKIKEVEEKPIPYWYPKNKMMNVDDDSLPWGMEWREGRNFRTVAELFTKRNLWAIAIIRQYATKLSFGLRDATLFALNAALLGVSKMVRESNTATMSGTYYLPQVSKEVNVFSSFSSKFSVSLKGWMEVNIQYTRFIISSQSATNLEEITSNSIDYIFTDPPYAGKVQYGELNFIWESWLGLDNSWHDEEIIVNPIRGKDEKDWENLMKKAISECFRVLKPGRWVTLCYHDTAEGTWSLVQDLMAEVGFVADKSDSVLFIDTQQKAYNQIVADKVNKRDLVINFRKPRPGEVIDTLLIQENDSPAAFKEKAQKIICEFLSEKPGSSKDRIYDEVVSRMVRAGTMQAHNFDEVLREVAEEVREPVKENLFENKKPELFGGHETGRWYLKEKSANEVDENELKKEEVAAARLEKFIKDWLVKNPHADGVHYSDLFESYIYTVKGKDKPRRTLADWLPEFFFKTTSGTWRLPMSDEEKKSKAETRTSGVHRRIRRFLSMLEQGLSVPEKEQPGDATLAEWIHQSRRAGWYEHGKMLYEIGGININNLEETLAADVEEDYQVCCRTLERVESGNVKKPQKRNPRKG